MKRVYSLLTVAILMGLISCGESTEEYNKRALLVADSIMSASEFSMSMAADRQTVWRELIYDNKYKGEYEFDWQAGLVKYNEDNSMFFDLIKKRRGTLDSLYKTLKEPPADSETLYKQIKDLYIIYTRVQEISLSSDSYSLLEYTKLVNELYEKFKAKKTEIDLEK